MQRPITFCCLLTLVLGTSLACSEPKHLLGEACVQHSQCESNYCQAGECANPPSATDASTDSSDSPADTSLDSSQDSTADAPDASFADSDSSDSFQKTDSTADAASD